MLHMSHTKTIIIIIFALIIGGFLLWFSARHESPAVSSVTPTFSESPTPTPTPTPSKSVSIAPSKQPQIPNKYPPAECSLSGSIAYISPTLYENHNAAIAYKNIDSVARQIKWSVFPQDGLSVGPNLFSGLPVPDGTEDVTVGLPQNPISKQYTLTAKVTYGRFINGNEVIKEAQCGGKITVTRP